MVQIFNLYFNLPLQAKYIVFLSMKIIMMGKILSMGKMVKNLRNLFLRMTNVYSILRKLFLQIWSKFAKINSTKKVPQKFLFKV